MEHYLLESSANGDSFSCVECCCEFDTSCALTKHQLTHVKTEVDSGEDCHLQWNSRFHSPDVDSSESLRQIDNLDSMFVCNQCKQSFSSRSLLKSHLNDHFIQQIIVDTDKKENVEREHSFPQGDEVLNICNRNTCLSQLNSMSCRSIHELSTSSFHPMVDLNSVCKCNACGKTFRSKPQLISHLRDQAKFSLEFCRNDRKGLAKNQNINEGNASKSINMSMDKQIMSQNVNLIGNTKQLHRKTRGSKFVNQINLPVHTRIHPRLQPYHCFTCDKLFSDPSNFRRHLLRHDGNAHKKKFVCSKCGYGFRSSFALRRHLLSHEDASFQCNECGKKFKYKDSLRSHSLLHSQKFECQCGITFSGKKELLRHQRNKHGIGLRKGTNKKFKCEICGKVFLYPSDLERHTQIHTRLFECNNCKQHFNVKSNLVKHIAVCDSLLWKQTSSKQSEV